MEYNWYIWDISLILLIFCSWMISHLSFICFLYLCHLFFCFLYFICCMYLYVCMYVLYVCMYVCMYVFFNICNSESINKILKKHLQKILHFRKLYLWAKSLKYIYEGIIFFSLPYSSFSKSPRNSIFIHLVYNEHKIISFLYICFNLHVYCMKELTLITSVKTHC